MTATLDGWVDITRRTAVQRRQATVTLAWRRLAKGLPVVEVRLNASLAVQMNWTRGVKARILVSPAGDRLALVRDEAGKVLRYRGKGLTVTHGLDWIDRALPARAAEAVDFDVVQDAVVVALPDWARAPDAPAPAETPEVASAPAESRAAPAVAVQSGRGRSAHTPERDALFRRLWPDRKLSVAAILRQINALDGPRLSSPTAPYAFARDLGLPSNRTEAYAAQDATEDAPLVPPQAEAPSTPATPPAASFPPAGFRAPVAVHDQRAAPADSDDEEAAEEAEAEALIRSAPDVWHGRRLADYFGWRMERASALVVRVRAELRRDGSA